jgi:phosphoadenosine phosphosulfate reductase
MIHAGRPELPTTANIAELDHIWHALTATQRLQSLRSAIAGRIVFTTSFGAEDQVLTHLIAEAGVNIELATLDTGRLFPETYDVWAETSTRYKLRITAHYPEQNQSSDLVEAQGINGFYNSIDARKACCGVRKIEPLKRALRGATGWVTGLRADQSTARQEVPFVARDDGFGLIKANPLRDWSRDQLSEFLLAHRIPQNTLHARGFVSIGCAPCTRAIEPGEEERAGRWWWEESAKECGLHVGADGRLQRAKGETVA